MVELPPGFTHSPNGSVPLQAIGPAGKASFGYAMLRLTLALLSNNPHSAR